MSHQHKACHFITTSMCVKPQNYIRNKMEFIKFLYLHIYKRYNMMMLLLISVSNVCLCSFKLANFFQQNINYHYDSE